LVSCSTHNTSVRPVAVVDTKPSYDGNKQDSGIIKITEEGIIVTQRFVDRYDALVNTYGAEPDFLPPLVCGQGVEVASKELQEKYPNRGTIYLMEKQTLVHFIKMNQWRKMAKEPKTKETPGVMSRVIEAITPSSL
jgi:hypothetical protein